MLMMMQGSSWAKEKALLLHNVAPFSLPSLSARGKGHLPMGSTRRPLGPGFLWELLFRGAPTWG